MSLPVSGELAIADVVESGGTQVALAQRLIAAEEQIVLLITGSVLKTPRFLQAHGRVVESDTDLEGVLRALGL